MTSAFDFEFRYSGMNWFASPWYNEHRSQFVLFVFKNFSQKKYEGAMPNAVSALEILISHPFSNEIDSKRSKILP